MLSWCFQWGAPFSAIWNARDTALRIGFSVLFYIVLVFVLALV